MQSEFVKINSNDYFVRTWGSPENPKILLLHGFPEHSNSWSKIAKYLKNSYYLIAPDQRGFGLSWAPAEEKWLEVSSCSNFEDFQARRGGIRYRKEADKKVDFVHTLNGSGLATPRLLIALLETYQNADGTVTVPKPLQDYTKLKIID